MNAPDITCVICTRDRGDSLRSTLACLANADRTGLNCEVVVVDNGSVDDTLEVARSFQDRMSVRVLEEPVQPGYGKGHALNRAVRARGLGEIVAVLDDDMSPHEDWFKGVAAICRRWPECELFSGSSYVVWPREEIPEWSRSPRIRGWAYSVMYGGPSERLLRPGRWYSGNHFWFRSRVLEKVVQFKDAWSSEIDFQMDASAVGSQGVIAPDAVAGHRVQDHLLDPLHLSERARSVGSRFADARMRPFRSGVRVAEAFRSHPLLMRVYCMLSVIRWSLTECLFGMVGRNHRWAALRFEAIERGHYFRALLGVAGECPEYSMSRRTRRRDLD